MSEQYKFKGGIKDGANVPDMLWILDVIEVYQHIDGDLHIKYFYQLNEDDKCWYFVGTEMEQENEQDCG